MATARPRRLCKYISYLGALMGPALGGSLALSAVIFASSVRAEETHPDDYRKRIVEGNTMWDRLQVRMIETRSIVEHSLEQFSKSQAYAGTQSLLVEFDRTLDSTAQWIKQSNSETNMEFYREIQKMGESLNQLRGAEKDLVVSKTLDLDLLQDPEFVSIVQDLLMKEFSRDLPKIVNQILEVK